MKLSLFSAGGEDEETKVSATSASSTSEKGAPVSNGVDNPGFDKHDEQYGYNAQVRVKSCKVSTIIFYIFFLSFLHPTLTYFPVRGLALGGLSV